MSLSFLESLRLAVSTDSVVHIWDPFMESVVSQVRCLKYFTGYCQEGKPKGLTKGAILNNSHLRLFKSCKKMMNLYLILYWLTGLIELNYVS